MATMDFLEKVRIFHGLNDDQLNKVDTCCEEAEYSRGDRLFKDGETAGYIYFLVDGKVDLRFDLPGRETSEENNVTSIQPGQTFGWSSLVPSNIYSLSSYAASRVVKVIRAKRECLLKLFESDPAMGHVVMTNLAEVISTRFGQLQSDVARRKGHDIMNNW
ncbi:MAG: cyclic nucleotide-binding domain-containing protein [Desulfatibacillaceae bacterium]